jgi:transcriptional regulator with XRE-family HTH domain
MPAAGQQEDAHPVDRAFGAVLRSLRRKRGLSQERLGHEAGSGRTYISQLERGEKGASLKMLFRLARQLDVSASEMVRRVERQLSAQRES